MGLGILKSRKTTMDWNWHSGVWSGNEMDLSTYLFFSSFDDMKSNIRTLFALMSWVINEFDEGCAKLMYLSKFSKYWTFSYSGHPPLSRMTSLRRADAVLKLTFSSLKTWECSNTGYLVNTYHFSLQVKVNNVPNSWCCLKSMMSSFRLASQLSISSNKMISGTFEF